MKALALAALVTMLAGCGGQQVEQYPDVDQDAEGQTSGSGSEIDRTAPPTGTGGPHPQDELSGENTEPL